ncbi:FAD binding domain-containing protein [Lachnoclostridium phytofermentans]|uniref:Molybdopterin dehydrogenase FAD-binding n=1 Tax=Lachnoclostridium phytofermentans (strain ATCC 700394 / DSM 18823 / ISDg) TaxID=357809 RepID=A9KQE0_LACP7|nr:FAD binding domain-containing protein [Lachnoclostridium phytofermentans]ABX40449.1 molybdopterin dehydrogenase FAD-binding [Lachnoclostridium phytofermentans ISDg]
MIANDFIYCKPENRIEAIKAYKTLSKEKKVFYYGGGSEIITMARAGSRMPDAVIDLKGIKECNQLELTDENLVIGGAVSLNAIEESGLFPLLGTTGSRIADHTNQCRITLGGNISGTIIYKETVLPLLLTDARIILYGPRGFRRITFKNAFDQEIKLRNGEFIYQIKIKKEMLSLPFTHVKKTAIEKIDYPLVTVCSITYENRLRFAISGLCPFPFRSLEIEKILNNEQLSLEEKLKKTHGILPESPITDYEGTGEYRLFVFDNIIKSILERRNDEVL